MSYTILEDGREFETQTLALAAAQIEANSTGRRVRVYPIADQGGADYVVVHSEENTK